MKNINDSKTEILADISGQILKLRSELSHTLERVGKIEKQLQDIEGLREEVAKLKEKAEWQDNISVAAELRIIGVPSEKHENLLLIVCVLLLMFHSISFSNFSHEK